MKGLFCYKLLVFLLYQEGTNYPYPTTIKNLDDNGLMMINKNRLAMRLEIDKWDLTLQMRRLESMGFLKIEPYPPKHKYIVRLNLPTLRSIYGDEETKS
jgi:hypothetical protein